MEGIDEIFKEVTNLDKNEILNMLKTVVKINTVVPPGDSYQEFIDTVSPYFKELGFIIKTVSVPEELYKQIPVQTIGERVNLIATKNYNQEKDICFCAHMDVVPAVDENKKWRFNPFEATMIKSGKIFGRGTADMKGQIVCLLLALKIIDKLAFNPKYNIKVVLCTDEEVGVYPGVRYLAEQGYLKSNDTIFCMEGMQLPSLTIGLVGDLRVEIETIGISCHSGRNFLGINALEEMVPIMTELLELKKIVEKRQSKEIPGVPRPENPDQKMLSPMFNLDVIRAGEKQNIVPDLCQLIVDRRVIPDENFEDVKREIEEAIERGKVKSKAKEVRTSFTNIYLPIKVDINSPAIRKMIDVISLVHKVKKDKILLFGAPGSTDMGFVSQILNKNDIIMRGAGNIGSNSHGVNENIHIKDIRKFIKEIILYLCADL